MTLHENDCSLSSLISTRYIPFHLSFLLLIIHLVPAMRLVEHFSTDRDHEWTDVDDDTNVDQYSQIPSAFDCLSIYERIAVLDCRVAGSPGTEEKIV
ncbi:uncharacterized protein EURHEDRAFT_284900 [Aspergillus ruber CBS 135680]|uniref:Uncharacterized protein n=1 Tax=Aspergillus ruber (strain CBS 135680) TaxID=1388766 RepID=A0A017S3G6_ASPRC|nr:uncharacterized protein EURHEDRAFT_284900 [Aspergillus ruber CBS 135680]EYE90730.1 hypothetical protein EURHEDRAFT_284900 [Aspergillus ruber CBS 135680]